MPKQQANLMTRPLLQLEYVQGNKYKLKETTFQEIAEQLAQRLLSKSTLDKPALVVESLVFDYKDVCHYDDLKARIHVIPGDMVELFFKESATPVKLEETE